MNAPPDSAPEWAAVLLWQFRVPRVVLAAMVGSGIGAAGWTIQRVTRNPLAQPAVLGVPAAAACAVMLLLWCGEGSLLGTFAVPAAAAGGGTVAAVMLLLCSGERLPWDGTRVLLVGTALGALFAALTFAIALHAEPPTYQYAMGWLAGSLGGASWALADALYAPWAVLLAANVLRTPQLLVLGFDDDTAGSLGIDAARARRRAFALAAALTAVCTAFGGALGFLGFAAPHLVRALAGRRFDRPDVAALAGAALLLGADALGQALTGGVEVPAGIVVSILCVPWFAFVLLRRAPWQSV